jgi:hypothetical protein
MYSIIGLQIKMHYQQYRIGNLRDTKRADGKQTERNGVEEGRICMIVRFLK